MFAKLAIVIVSVGLCGATLLAYRQARIQTVHELTAARLDSESAEERGRRLAIQIAARTTPDAVSRAAEALGPMRTPDPSSIPSEARGPQAPAIDQPVPPAPRDSLDQRDLFAPLPDVEVVR